MAWTALLDPALVLLGLGAVTVSVTFLRPRNRQGRGWPAPSIPWPVMSFRDSEPAMLFAPAPLEKA